MKHMIAKRMLVVALVVLLCAGLFPMAAFAAELPVDASTGNLFAEMDTRGGN